MDNESNIIIMRFEDLPDPVAIQKFYGRNRARQQVRAVYEAMGFEVSDDDGVRDKIGVGGRNAGKTLEWLRGVDAGWRDSHPLGDTIPVCPDCLMKYEMDEITVSSTYPRPCAYCGVVTHGQR